jgi:N,N'-diacetyllegionaminate synthase
MVQMKYLDIAGRRVGPGCEPFVILEAGINHNGDMALLRKMIDEAVVAGADAIKFQTFKAEEFISDPHQTYTYKSQGRQITESMLDIFKRFELSEPQWQQVFTWCRDSGILGFSTPQNPSDLDFLLNITDLPVIKVGSDDLTNLELLRYYAAKGLPVIISAGMAFISEVEDAVRAVRSSGNQSLAVLHCVSSYPAAPEALHLNKILTLSGAFDLPVGFSDHSQGNTAAVTAVSLGACILEKHFTLDKNLPGPDHWFSADPAEARTWVQAIRDCHRMRGTGIIEPAPEELQMRAIARRSIVAARDLAAGIVLTRADMAFKRPGTGVPPRMVNELIGQRIARPIARNSLITFDAFRTETHHG